MGDKAYHSMQEFEEVFFPKNYRRRLLESLPPEEPAKFLAQEAIEEVRQQLLEKRDESTRSQKYSGG